MPTQTDESVVPRDDPVTAGTVHDPETAVTESACGLERLLSAA
jgi:hypothetical protein